jgi:hypothetical protein
MLDWFESDYGGDERVRRHSGLLSLGTPTDSSRPRLTINVICDLISSATLRVAESVVICDLQSEDAATIP